MKNLGSARIVSLGYFESVIDLEGGQNPEYFLLTSYRR